MRRLLALLVSVAVASALALGLVSLDAIAASPSLAVPNVSDGVNQRVTINFTASDFSEPGLGAWTIDLGYDASVVSAISCSSAADLSVCNAHYASGKVRFAGASARGLTGNFAIASVVFECGSSAGTSPLTILPKDVYDATPVNLQPLSPSLNNGSIVCGPAPSGMPEAGSGGGLVHSQLALALMGVLAMISIIAVSRALPYAKRRVA